MELPSLRAKLILTCHIGPVNAMAFPYGCSELFATCSTEDVRIWASGKDQELLRITVANLECTSVAFSKSGKSIITGWSDGELRCFTPETGKLVFVIHNAHKAGVSAIAVTADGQRVISGGREGIVRVWKITPKAQTLLASLSEHKGAVTSIHVRSNDEECATSSTDGSCIIWDLQRYLRSQIMFANTLFMGVRYHPSECQVVTCGSDRKLGFWETQDGTLVRELVGSDSAMNVIDVTSDGRCIVIGGEDRIVRLWRYSEGDVSHDGLGHSSPVTSTAISPDTKYILTGSQDGAIFCWKFPDVVTRGKPALQK